MPRVRWECPGLWLDWGVLWPMLAAAPGSEILGFKSAEVGRRGDPAMGSGEARN